MVKLMVALMELCPRSRVLDIEPKPHEAYYADIPCRDLVPTEEASLRTATAHWRGTKDGDTTLHGLCKKCSADTVGVCDTCTEAHGAHWYLCEECIATTHG